MSSGPSELWLPSSATNASEDLLAKLIGEVADGAITLDTAREMTRDGVLRREISADSVSSVIQTSFHGTQSSPLQNQPEGTLPLAPHELAYEAARAMHEAETASAIGERDSVFARLWLLTGSLLLQALTSIAAQRGDPRLLHRAEAVASETLAACEVLPYPENHGLILFEYGQFHLLPYTTNKVVANYVDDVRDWIDRPRQENDLNLLELTHKMEKGDQESKGWPALTEALKLAEKYLREALSLVPPDFQGLVLLRLVSALEWRWKLEEPIDTEELCDLARQASEALDPGDLFHRLKLAATVSHHGVDPDPALIAALENDWDTYVTEAGEHDAWAATHQAAFLLRKDDPARALRLLERRNKLTQPWSDEAMVGLHLSYELQLFAEANGPYGPTRASEDLQRAMNGSLALAKVGKTPHGGLVAAAALSGTMAAALALDEPDVGITLSEAINSIDQSLWANRSRAVHYLVARVLVQAAGRRAEDAFVDAALEHYCDAASHFAYLGIPVKMVRCLEGIHGLLDKDFKHGNSLTVWLAENSLRLELISPSSAPSAINAIGVRSLSRLFKATGYAEAIQNLFGVIKGRRYEAMLAKGPGRFESSPEFEDLLSREAAAQMTVPAENRDLLPEQIARSAADDHVLAAWVNDYEEDRSDSAAGRLAGIQRSIERTFWAAMTPDQTDSRPILLTTLLKHLDDRTALLQLLEGETSDGEIGIYQILLYQGQVDGNLVNTKIPRTQQISNADGRRVFHTPFTLPLVRLRRDIQEDPGPLDLIPSAQGLLAELSYVYLQMVIGERERLLREGIENLVVVPHGPSHHLPFHLFGDDDGPIAEHFVVSQVLHASQILPAATKQQEKDGVGVFGLSYADQAGFAVLDDSYEECAAIAEACDSTPQMDQAATPEAFKAALESCRHVHLRAHGRANADAPSLHTVFLHPGATGDGRLRAYEIAALDLSGLELVTLGACETGLGRVDQFDNPRGFPAMLMLAGARAVIGTLWPTAATVSKFFFSRLYEALMQPTAGELRTSFQGARLATRALYPQSRDWGAFYLIGGVEG